MRAARTIGSLFGMAAVVGLLIAVAAMGRAGSPSAPVGAVGSPEPAPSIPASSAPAPSIELGLACGTYITDVLRYAAPLDELTDASDGVVVATVTSVGEGRWATPGGGQPSFEEGQRPTALDVHRTVTIEINEVAKDARLGLAKGQSIDIRMLGGTIGCRTFLIAGDAEPRPGDSFALFLSAEPNPRLGALNPGLEVVAALPIDNGVAGDNLRSFPVDELLATVRESD